MKHLNLILLAFLPIFASAAPGVDTGGERGTTYTQERDIQRTKQLNAEESSQRLDTKARQKLRSKELSRTVLSEFTSTSEIPLSSVLTPIIAETEMALQGKDRQDLNYVQYILQQCRLYSGSVAIPTAFPYKQPGSYTLKPNSGPNDTNWLIPADEPSHGFVKEEGLAILGWTWSMNKSVDNAFARLGSMEQVSKAIGQRVDNPAMPLRCYYVYSKLGEAVITDLEGWGVGSERSAAGKNIDIFLGEDLDRIVGRVFYLRVLMGLPDQDEIEQLVVKNINEGCRLPTLSGVISNNVGWRCGGITVDPLADKATQGGMTLLDQNVYFGRSATITKVNEVALAKAYLDSDVSEVSREDVKTAGQSTSLSKSSTNSSRSQTGVGSSASSGVGSSGQN